jgi:hypothetical protein
MSDPTERPLHELQADHALIEAALQRAVREAILQHARTGDPIAVWRDGKVVWVSASEVLTRENGSGGSATSSLPSLS